MCGFFWVWGFFFYYFILILFYFLVCCIYSFREWSKFNLRKEIRDFHGKVVGLQWTERESDYGSYCPLDIRWILKALLKDRAFSAVLLLLLFVIELPSCYLGERGDQRGQQRPWKHSARIWNLNWGVANAYFVFEDWERVLGPKEYRGREGVALILFLSLLFQSLSRNILVSECSQIMITDCVNALSSVPAITE